MHPSGHRGRRAARAEQSGTPYRGATEIGTLCYGPRPPKLKIAGRGDLEQYGILPCHIDRAIDRVVEKTIPYSSGFIADSTWRRDYAPLLSRSLVCMPLAPCRVSRGGLLRALDAGGGRQRHSRPGTDQQIGISWLTGDVRRHLVIFEYRGCAESTDLAIGRRASWIWRPRSSIHSEPVLVESFLSTLYRSRTRPMPGYRLRLLRHE